MRLLYYVVVLFVATLCMSSCVKNKNNSLRVEARELYTESLNLANIYVDSISKAKDSTTLLGICERYDNILTKLNYSYSAGADYEMSEGENDTLTNLSNRFVAIRDSLLYAFAHPPVAEGDSATTLISQELQSN